MSTRVNRQLMDLISDAYIDWREECDAVRRTYRAWSVAPRGQRDLTFHAYAGALNREQDAANNYAAVIRHATEVIAEPARAA